jgi:hypothetical protein
MNGHKAPHVRRAGDRDALRVLSIRARRLEKLAPVSRVQVAISSYVGESQMDQISYGVSEPAERGLLLFWAHWLGNNPRRRLL